MSFWTRLPNASTAWTHLRPWRTPKVLEQAGGIAGENLIFALNDLVVIQVDADVARNKYKDYGIKDAPDDELTRGTCEKACPPPSATTDGVRAVMLGWLNETSTPPGAVLCTPSKNIETWVLAALFPEDESAKRPNLECGWDGEVRLRKYGLIKSHQKHIDKCQDSEKGIQDAWPDVNINRRYALHLNILGERPVGPTQNEATAKALMRWSTAERQTWLDAVTKDPLLPKRILPVNYLGQQSWRKRVEALGKASAQLRGFKPSGIWTRVLPGRVGQFFSLLSHPSR